MAVTTIYACAYRIYKAPFRTPSPRHRQPSPTALAGGGATTLLQAMDKPPWDVYYALGIRPGAPLGRTVP